MLDKARQFAINAHGDEKYGEHPYIFHLDVVVALLEPYGEAAKTIGYLHDVVENTGVPIGTIENQFGGLVARCVAILTDEHGENRRTRKEKAYERLARVQGEEELALVVSAADRLANIQACIADGKKDLLKMYRRELDAFRTSVHRPGLCEDLWSGIEKALGR